ncbi:helix-turn-helix domain-containing protein [Brevibacillus sp. NPDC003359]|uniref:helix-turn-helix domain-containing protein n=1 Tax=unclassified Brevibacillus TaxID=2684853 RepID=UPI0036793501
MTSNPRTELNLKIEELRLNKKYTLRQAAHKSGLSHAYIRDLELNKNRKTGLPIIPTPQALQKLASAYDGSYDELMKLAGFVSTETDPFDAILEDPELTEEKKEIARKLRDSDLNHEQMVLIKGILENFKASKK